MSQLKQLIAEYMSTREAYLQRKAEIDPIKERLKALDESVRALMKHGQIREITYRDKVIELRRELKEKSKKKEVLQSDLLRACKGNTQHAENLWNIMHGKQLVEEMSLNVLDAQPFYGHVNYDEIQ